ncbi:aromatic acid/H+ symport family MFS transporter [Paenarthrobacter sp. A20]|uniref:MFS transporter n=1 Tax=Paenarthrobacter sp. A20 TaxID=2817891 RepID=UPI00209C99BC|nr:aromatic acid/H+ symport family MFS transporter [Paenarthrobacter sp. A20]MCP1415583.1 AAHS family benzoate transporter-like MFS transporter [Paenarthrobacter sp. A20]
MSHPSPAGVVVPTSRGGLVIGICAAMILFDGYDLIVFGNVIPSLIAEPGWQVTPAIAGRIASLTLVGMLIGALVAGTLSDRLGRRSVVIISLAWFSLTMAACAVAPDPRVFEIARIIGGLGLGALFPTVTALVIEVAPERRKALAYSFTLFGYLAGGIVAGILALALIPTLGWRSLFWAGALPILLVPVAMKFLPESPAWLAAKSAPASLKASRKSAMSSISALFKDGFARNTILAWGVQFCSLLLVFGMVNWLPTIMISMGYNLQSALFFAVTLNVGAAVGSLIGARLADKGLTKKVTAVLFIVGCLSVAALSFGPPTAVMFALVALAGAGTLGTQILVNVFVSSIYPAHMRGTGLGWALGIGRLGAIVGPLIGGAILGAGMPAQWNFYIFALVAALGMLLVLPIAVQVRANNATNNVDAVRS